MKLLYSKNLFTLTCDYKIGDIPRRAGFLWDAVEKCWVSPFSRCAAKISSTREMRNFVIDRIKDEKLAIKKSASVSSDITVPKGCPDLDYFPYQLAGIEEMIRRDCNILLADQMGLGKTIQVLGLINVLYSNPLKKPKILIICPASLKHNWLAEFNKWNTLDIEAAIITSKSFIPKDLNIINYDILEKYKEAIHSNTYDLLILDECHYLKNSKAARTQMVCGHKRVPGIAAKKIIALSGTPIVNKPIELFAILRYLYRFGFANKTTYVLRYCAARNGPFGWDVSGASNLEELQYNLRSTVMIRRLKEDVLCDLPPKLHQIIELDSSTGVIEKNLLKRLIEKIGGVKNEVLTDAQFRAAVKSLYGGDDLSFECISTIRKEAGIDKIPHITKHLEDILNEKDKVVCFCHHKEVIKQLKENFKDICVVVDGSVSAGNKDTAVRQFQTVKRIKLFIGNIQAAGIGITLTAASHVVFSETSWVPGEMEQAADRCHRIGQNDTVLVQYLVLKDSIDAYMVKTIVRKQEIIKKAVDPAMSEALKFLLS